MTDDEARAREIVAHAIATILGNVVSVRQALAWEPVTQEIVAALADARREALEEAAQWIADNVSPATETEFRMALATRRTTDG